MNDIPSELRFAETHEWAELLEDGVVRVGLSDHAQEQLGDMVFVELPEEGEEITRGEACAVVESVKAASDIYAPVTGQVVSANEALNDSPEIVNNDPYGDGWLFTVRPADENEFDELMDADAYAQHIEE